MARIRSNNLSSYSTGVTASLALNGTTVTWSADPKLPTVASPDFMPIVINPNTATAEVISITAHTAGATTSTCTRLFESLQVGTATAAAVTNVSWADSPTVADFGDTVLTTAVSATVNAQRRVIVTATAQTITLPAVAAGRVVTVKLTVAGTCTVVGATGTIDGAVNFVINVQNQADDFVSDGTNWFVV